MWRYGEIREDYIADLEGSELYKGVKHLGNYITFRIMFVFRKGHGPIPTC